MPGKPIEGGLSARGLSFAIVQSRFNSFITDRLLEGAMDAFTRAEAKEEQIQVVRTPGSFEIPMVAKAVAQTRKFDAVLCLGAVIRGGTPHFEYVASEVAKGIAQVSLETGVPVIFAVITADTIEQAVERAGAKMGNKGFNGALSAIEMANLMRRLKEEQ